MDTPIISVASATVFCLLFRNRWDIGRWFSASFSLMSGHWENGAPEVYEMHVMGGETWEAQYFHGVNNYQMPMVLRLDLGYQRTFKTGRIEHELNLGICNATNHFNPFMLYYDSKEEKWTALALLPILPTFNYKVLFLNSAVADFDC